MVSLLRGIAALHNAVFGALQAIFENWLLGLLARVMFSSVTMVWLWNSALTKVVSRGSDGGVLDYFTVEANAMAQIAPKAFENAGYDASLLGPEYWLIAYAGTFGEFILPLLILIGLFTRVAALGMIGFMAVLTWVDVTGHGAVTFELSKMFDRMPSDIVMDQRMIWLFPLIYLVLRGPGAVSIDGLYQRVR